MPDAVVQLSDLIDDGTLEIGAGRPRTAGADLPVLRVADVLDGRIQPSVKATDVAGPGRLPRRGSADREAYGPKVSKPGDIVLTTKGTVGRVALMPVGGPAFAYSPQICYFRPGTRGRLEFRYLYYWFRGPEFVGQIAPLKSQTDMADFVSLQDLVSLKLHLPPIARQRAIAEMLGALDDKIAASQIATSKSDDLIEAHYRWAISRSDAVARPLLDVVDVTYGEAFKGTHFSEPGVGRPLIRIRDLKTSSPQVWTTESRARETIIHPGDVVVGMDAEFRASWWLGEPGLLNQRVLRATAKHASRAFARECLRRPLAALEGEKSATTVIHLNKSDLERSQVQVPDDESLAHFDAVAEPIRLARVALALENTRLAATRDELLPLLMSGKIRVKDAEKSLEGVL